MNEPGVGGTVRAVRTLRRQGAPAGLYASKYRPELGAAICRRLAAGESLRAICRTDVAMPTEKTVWNWARAHPEFRAMKAHALAVARAARLAAQGSRDRARREEAEARYLAVKLGPDGRGPSAPVDGRTAAWNLGFDGCGGGRGRAARRVLERLACGASLEEICGPGREAGLPSVGTVYNWLRRHPAFLAAYRAARARQPEMLVSWSTDGAEWQGTYAASMRDLERRIRAAERAAARMAPKGYATYAGPARLSVTREAAPGGPGRTLYEGEV